MDRNTWWHQRIEFGFVTLRGLTSDRASNDRQSHQEPGLGNLQAKLYGRLTEEPSAAQ